MACAGSSSADASGAQLAHEKETALRRQAMEWEAPVDISTVPLASAEDIPLVDLAAYHAAVANGGDVEAAERRAADELRKACESAGFLYLVHHGIDPAVLQRLVAAATAFHALPLPHKLRYKMDAGAAPAGTGYLPSFNQKLPARDKPNVNGAFIIKREHGPRNVTLGQMPWPESHAESGFDADAFIAAVTDGCAALEGLAKSLLPLYATALGQPRDYFGPAFTSPLFRLRLAHYPPTPPGEFGINPHLDTSFFTLLLTTDASGLVVYSHARKAWVRAQPVPHALIVNTGETLSRITNDRWPATRHYAVNPVATAEEGGHVAADRYSVPFFFNPTADFRMAVVPSCCSEADPPRYEPESYLDGQGVVQGE